MDLGGDTSKGQADPDDPNVTLPLDVGGRESWSNTYRIRYHLPDDDQDDVERDDEEGALAQ